ncbi:hypothetical protein N692_04495 [Lactiplantibacillus plantarum EGD-AQ4]|nr:hypothetical protein N692_04495 [Lactiplantibacillus plantarum EGD-AQ4]
MADERPPIWVQLITEYLVTDPSATILVFKFILSDLILMWSAHYRLISMVIIFKTSEQNHIVYGIKGFTISIG